MASTPGAAPQVGQVLGRSILLWVRNGRVCWLFPLILMLPYLFAERVLDQLEAANGGVDPWAALVGLVLGVPTLAVVQGTVSAAALRWAQGRVTPSGKQLVGQVWSLLPSLVLVTLCTYGVALLPYLRTHVLLLIVPGLLAFTLLWLAVPTLISEPELTGFEALVRSVQVTRPHWWRLLPLALLVPALGIALLYPLAAIGDEPGLDVTALQLLVEAAGVGILTLQAVAQSLTYHQIHGLPPPPRA
ncbi:MAG: hypothetical protein QM767_21615 [Anaeromyxobacter sp.]